PAKNLTLSQSKTTPALSRCRPETNEKSVVEAVKSMVKPQRVSGKNQSPETVTSESCSRSTKVAGGSTINPEPYPKSIEIPALTGTAAASSVTTNKVKIRRINIPPQ